MTTDQIADLFAIPREVARAWERQALEARLLRALWAALISKHMAELSPWRQLVVDFYGG